jgi:small subunit ribosomal protein S9
MKGQKTEKYFEGIGRRKTSVARVRIMPAPKNNFKINGKELVTYFPTKELQILAMEAIEKAKAGSFNISALIKGGGIHSQAEALRHGIARAILKLGEGDFKDKLKPAGLLKRDPRSKERRKFGLKKARKAPQWSKR